MQRESIEHLETDVGPNLKADLSKSQENYDYQSKSR